MTLPIAFFIGVIVGAAVTFIGFAVALTYLEPDQIQ